MEINLEELLNSGAGDYPRIKAFREKLKPEERFLFDKILLIGIREGINLALNSNNCVPNLNHSVPPNTACIGCCFWDTPAFPDFCRIGLVPSEIGCMSKRKNVDLTPEGKV